MKVLEVTYKGDYSINVLFEDGVSGTVQLNDLVQKGIFQVLKNTNHFSKIFTTGYSIAWSEELEIDAATIYAAFTGKDFGEAFTPKYSNATN